MYLFQELTGLQEAPRFSMVRPGSSVEEARPGAGIKLASDCEQGTRAPLHMLYEAMGDLLDTAVPLAGSLSEIFKEGRRLARVKGRLRATRFPDGNLNLELLFAGVRGLVFYTEEYFNSLIRPVLHNDRVFTMEETVEALIYLLGPVQRIIFYHQTYGDNQEYDWVPVAPAVIRSLGVVGEGAEGPR